MYPHKRRTKNSQVQAGLITEAERETDKIKDRESAHTHSYTVHFTAKKESQPTIEQARIIKNMSNKRHYSAFKSLQQLYKVKGERARESRTPQYAPSTKATQESGGSGGERDGEGSKAEVTKREGPKEWQRGEWHGTRRERTREGEK